MARRRNTAQPVRLGIDLGGTKILAAAVDADGEIIGQAKQPTAAALGPDAVIERIVTVAERAMAAAGLRQDDVEAAGVGAPAPVDVQTGIVYGPPNLPGWSEVRLGPRLEQALGFPVFVDNDVNCGTLGEFELGAGRGARDTVGIFVGTGVGGGVVVDGQLHRGFRYAAGELGHMIVVPNGPLCSCGRRGCLEAVASRTAIEREVNTGLAAGLPTVLGELMAGSKRDRLTSGVIAKAMAAGDPLMVDVMTNVQFYLGLLVANLVNLLDPEVVVFGGGVVEALGDDFLEPIREIARPNFKLQQGRERVRIVPAQLGDHAAVLGAVIVARQQLALRRRQN